MKATVYLGGEWVLEGTAEEIADAMAKYDFSKYLQKKTSILTTEEVIAKRGAPDCENCGHFQAMFPYEMSQCQKYNKSCKEARENEILCGHRGKDFDPTKREAK